MKYLAKYLAVAAIYAYRLFVSPFFPPSCRFQPTCSDYALEAFKRCGFLGGLRRSVGRFLRCHPFGRAGYDPVD